MEYFTKFDYNTIICDVCPRHCRLKVGQSGFCKVRKNTGEKIELESYGHITLPAIDPVEKKPLYHFFPSSKILSFGTYGCNMGCRFCQNYNITKTQNNPFLLPKATPKELVKIAKKYNCKSIAFTYNDPVVFFDYAIDVANLARSEGIYTVAVSAGYICARAREQLFSKMDAVNLDLKSFSRDFYRKNCLADLDVVLDTIKYVHDNTNAWLEITTLLIEGQNDSDNELEAMCKWLVENVGANVPLHFSAFHGAYKFSNMPPTKYTTLKRAYDIARSMGINYVYTGNVINTETSCTYCRKCGAKLIERERFQVTNYNLDELSRCKKCSTKLDGCF